MEGQELYALVKGRIYNAELRSELAKFGLRRISNSQWVSKTTATKYELLFEGEGENKMVVGVDMLDQGNTIHIGKEMTVTEEPQGASVLDGIHHKTVNSFYRQLDIARAYEDCLRDWNQQIYYHTPWGEELAQKLKRSEVFWYDLLFLPDPLASGSYIYGTIRRGKVAAMHSWLDMPDDSFITPSDDSEEGVRESLESGIQLHAFEASHFETAAAAGQYAIRMLNASKSGYAMAIRKLLGKQNGSITRNDFYRNPSGEMCRIEKVMGPHGLHFEDVPVNATVADCIDSLIAPFVKARARQEMGY